MNEQFKEQITAKAREFATAYTNRHFPNQPAFAFGNEGWAKFVDALVELSHPKSKEADSGVIAAPVVPAPGALDGAHSDQVALLLSKVRVAACVIENLPELPGYNGSVLTIDDTEAARISKELYEIAEFLDKPQAAPVAQLSEPPEGWVEPMERFAALVEAETLKAHQQAIEAAVLAEREACKEVCAQLSKEYREAYKGRATKHPDAHYNPHMDGKSDGASCCEEAIEARTQPMRTIDAHKEDA